MEPTVTLSLQDMRVITQIAALALNVADLHRELMKDDERVQGYDDFLEKGRNELIEQIDRLITPQLFPDENEPRRVISDTALELIYSFIGHR